MSQQGQHEHSHSHGSHSHVSHDHHNHQHCHDVEQDEEAAEQLHLIKVISAFANYKRHAQTQNQRRRRDYSSLPEHHKKLVPHYLTKINQVDDCIQENMSLIRAIVQSASMFLPDQHSSKEGDDTMMTATKTNNKPPPVSPMDMDKVKSTLKQFVRDWSKEVHCLYDNILFLFA